MLIPLVLHAFFNNTILPQMLHADAIGVFEGCSHLKLQNMPKGTKPLRNVNIINETGYAQKSPPPFIMQTMLYSALVLLYL